MAWFVRCSYVLELACILRNVNMSLKKSYAAVVSSSDSESESSLRKSTSDEVLLRSRTSAPRVTDSKVSNCIDRSGKNKVIIICFPLQYFVCIIDGTTSMRSSIELTIQK